MKSKKPSKQRKKLYQASLHQRGKNLSAPLSADLKLKYKANSAMVRRGDTVKVLRGDRKGFEGKVSRVDRKNYRIFIDGISRDKADGTTVLVPIHASKVMLVNLNLDDKWRRKILERRGIVVEVAPPEEKPEEKIEEAEKVQELAEVKAAGGT